MDVFSVDIFKYQLKVKGFVSLFVKQDSLSNDDGDDVGNGARFSCKHCNKEFIRKFRL